MQNDFDDNQRNGSCKYFLFEAQLIPAWTVHPNVLDMLASNWESNESTYKNRIILVKIFCHALKKISVIKIKLPHKKLEN